MLELADDRLHAVEHVLLHVVGCGLVLGDLQRIAGLVGVDAGEAEVSTRQLPPERAADARVLYADYLCQHIRPEYRRVGCRNAVKRNGVQRIILPHGERHESGVVHQRAVRRALLLEHDAGAVERKGAGAVVPDIWLECAEERHVRQGDGVVARRDAETVEVVRLVYAVPRFPRRTPEDIARLDACVPEDVGGGGGRFARTRKNPCDDAKRSDADNQCTFCHARLLFHLRCLN